MKTLTFASLAFAIALPASTAVAKRMPEAAPPRPGSAAANTCRAAGRPLFEIRHRSEISAPTSTVSVYANGAWTYVPVAEDGTRGTTAGGCLAKDDMATIRNALKAAPWESSRQKIRCMAYSPNYTQYVVHGKVKFREQMCSGDVLDEASRASIDKIESLLPKH